MLVACGVYGYILNTIGTIINQILIKGKEIE